MTTTPAEHHPATSDTTGADQSSPVQEPPKSGAPPMQVARLKEFLAAEWPQFEAPVGEHAADTAIRLIRTLSATSPVTHRCTEQYCNQARGHGGEHGWVVTG